MKRITLTSGIEMAYWRSPQPAPSGSSAPPLLLVHGFTGNADDFRTQREALAEHSPVVIPELRGHGGSTHTGSKSDYTLDALGADLIAFIEQLGGGPVHLVGHSLAGMLALRIASLRPELLASLVLMSSTPLPLRGIERGALSLAGRLARESGMTALATALRKRAENDDRRDAADRRIEREWGAERFWTWRRARLEAMDPVAYEALALSMLEQPAQTAQLAAIQLPTLVLVGALDTSFLEPSRLAAREIPGARLVVLPDAGHQPQHEAPEAWRGAILEHLARCRADTR